MIPDARFPKSACQSPHTLCDGLFLTPVPTPVLGEGLLLSFLVTSFFALGLHLLEVTNNQELITKN
jgi:hypothetical protein